MNTVERGEVGLSFFCARGKRRRSRRWTPEIRRHRLRRSHPRPPVILRRPAAAANATSAGGPIGSFPTTSEGAAASTDRTRLRWYLAAGAAADCSVRSPAVLAERVSAAAARQRRVVGAAAAISTEGAATAVAIAAPLRCDEAAAARLLKTATEPGRAESSAPSSVDVGLLWILTASICAFTLIRSACKVLHRAAPPDDQARIQAPF